MAQIVVKHVVGNENSILVIDNEGRIWSLDTRSNGGWRHVNTLPDDSKASEPESKSIQLEDVLD